MSHLPEGIQTEEHVATARMYPHRIKAIPLSGMWKTVPPAIAFNAALENTHKREAVRLHLLSQIL
jgi:hypothetical protein